MAKIKSIVKTKGLFPSLFLTAANREMKRMVHVRVSIYSLFNHSLFANLANMNNMNPPCSMPDKIFFFFICYSLFLVSIHIVTGPSLSSSTFMSAPNSPVPTGLPRAVLKSLQNFL